METDEKKEEDKDDNPYESMVRSLTNRGKNKRKVKLLEDHLIQFAFGDSDSEDDEDFTVEDDDVNSDDSDDGDGNECDRDSAVSEDNQEASDTDEDSSQDETKTIRISDVLSAVRSPTKPRELPIPSDNDNDSVLSQDQMDIQLTKPLLICGICLESEDSENDEILECDNCGITVHEGCYGDIDVSDDDDKSESDAPTEPWFCEPCKAGLIDNHICELCPNVGGIYKQTDSGKWVHLICALYTPYVGFRDVSKLQTVVLEDIKTSMWGSQECMFCVDDNFSRTGVCINCDAGLCKTTFHVTCAQRNGFLSDIPDKGDADEEAAELLYAHCKLHSVKLEVTKRMNSWLAFQSHVSRFKHSDDNFERERIQHVLSLAQQEYREFRRFITPAKQPPHEYIRLLSSCPEACMMLAKKAEILGLLRHPGYNVAAAVTSGRILKHEANLSAEFVNYFFKREMQVKEIGYILKNSEPLLSKMQIEQKVLTTKSEEFHEKLENVEAENKRLISSCQELHDHLCKLSGKSLKLPEVLRPKHAKETKAKIEESTKLLNAIVNKCATCKTTEDQHLLTRCAVCQNYYHFACVDPPLLRMPKKSDKYVWQCTECDPSEESESESEILDDSADADGIRRTKRVTKEPEKYTPDTPKGIEEKEPTYEPIPAKRKSVTKNDEQYAKKKKVSIDSSTKEIINNESPKKENNKINKETKPKEKKRQRTPKPKKVKPPPEMLSDCCVCNKNGDKTNLVKCDECKKCYHFKACLDPPYSKSPKGKFWGWICEDCDESVDEDEEGEKKNANEKKNEIQKLHPEEEG